MIEENQLSTDEQTKLVDELVSIDWRRTLIKERKTTAVQRMANVKRQQKWR